MKFYKIPLLSLLLLMNLSCSNFKELNPEEAMEILSNEFLVTCDKRLITTNTNLSEDFQRHYQKAEELSKVGLITIESKFYRGFGGGGHTKYYYKPTEALKKEYQKGSNTYMITKSHVVEIIGISHNRESNTASVSFEYIMEPTFLYEFRGFVNGKRQDCPTNKEQGEAEFILYDTGWRLKK